MKQPVLANAGEPGESLADDDRLEMVTVPGHFEVGARQAGDDVSPDVFRSDHDEPLLAGCAPRLARRDDSGPKFIPDAEQIERERGQRQRASAHHRQRNHRRDVG